MSSPRVKVWVQRFPDRNHLVLQWHDPDTGQRKSRTAGTSDETDAERNRADLEYELNHGTYQEPAKLDWARFRDLFEAEYLPGVRPTTQEKYRSVLDVFEQIVRPERLRSVTERTLSAFVKGMRERKRPGGKVGLAPMTMHNYLVALKSVLGWAVSQKLLPAVPTFPEVHVPKKKPQPVPAESFERLLDKAPDERWKAFLMCGWWAGLRLSEARHLRWEPADDKPWVDLAGNRIVLPATFAKSAEDQWVPLHTVLRAALEQLPREGVEVFPFRNRATGRLLARTTITCTVRDIARKAGVRLSMHKLRKGFGCRVAKQLGKGQAPILHELMRHSSMQITMDYYASVDDMLQDVMRALT
jgi:integrase